MPSEYADDSGVDGDGYKPIANSGGPVVVDPQDFGGSGASGAGNNDGNDGGDFDDGYGPEGKYGRGRFPDGTSRKRRANGSGPIPSGTAAPGVATGARKSRTSKPLDPHGIEVILLGIHAGISKLFESDIPVDERIIPLSPEDAKSLAVATANVARHYPQLETSAKVWDHIQLCTIAAGIYGPMLAMLAYRKNEQRLQRKSQNVVPFNAR